MKILGYLIILILFFTSCGGSQSDDIKDSSIKEQHNTDNEETASISFVSKAFDVFTEVYLQNGENKRYVTSIDAPGFIDITQDEYSKYDIPTNALAAIRTFWAGMSEVIYVLERSDNSYDLLFAQKDEMESGPYAFQRLRRISFSSDDETELEPPFFIINTAAVKDVKEAELKVEGLQEEGYPADYLWIPDYASLSGAEFYTVYIGPYKTKQECAIAVDQYRVENPKAYGTLVSHQPGRVTVGGINDAVK